LDLSQIVLVRARSHSLTNGRIKLVKRYTAGMIEWLAVYDRTTDRCYYIPAAELGDAMNCVSLRLTPARNNQRRRIRYAGDYVELVSDRRQMGPSASP
jgi:hypothetical protein